MMNGLVNNNPKKKVSKKLMKLFEGEYNLRIIQKIDNKKKLQKKVKDLLVLNSSPSKSSKIDPKNINITKDFDIIPQVPTIQLQEVHMENFFVTCKLINENYQKYGIVKLHLPKNYEVEKLNIRRKDKKIMVRQQVLTQLREGKPFVNIKDAYDFDEFKEFSLEIDQDYKYETPEQHNPDHKYLRDEMEYWGIVHGEIEKECSEDEDGFTVEYGADLPIDQYGESSNKIIDENKLHFSLREIYKLDESLFQIIKKKTESISGLVIPWAYVASKFSTFCYHTEDLFLYSYNYMHEGGCKIWY